MRRVPGTREPRSLTDTKVERYTTFLFPWDFSLQELYANSRPFSRQPKLQPDEKSHDLLTGVQILTIAFKSKSVPTIWGSGAPSFGKYS